MYSGIIAQSKTVVKAGKSLVNPINIIITIKEVAKVSNANF